MSKFHLMQSSTALFTALTLISGGTAPLVMQVASAQAQTRSTTTFSDVTSGYWANGYIQELASRNILTGFPDGSFRPDEPVTRAQFAAMLRTAFNRNPVRNTVNFKDVPSDYWASAAIRDAYSKGFMSGYPENDFRPGEYIPRAQVLVALTNGLGYVPSGAVGTTLQSFSDASSIPDWARNSIAAATEKKIVVNYPNAQYLNPTRPATRSEVAAFIYQAMASAGDVAAVMSPYVVGQASAQIPIGTTLPTRYDKADKILLSMEEPNPVPVSLTINRNITSAAGKLLIPADSEVVGELRVEKNKGARFFAKTLIMPDGTEMPISATSQLMTQTEEVRRGANVLELLAGAALGAGAAAGVAAVTGDRAVATEEVLGGGAVGTLLATFLGRNRITLISIDPNTDLDLTLDSPLALL
jgi:S-layer homology domain